MRATSKLLALALAAVLQPALADVVSINFEAANAAPAANQFAAQGINFSSNAWVVRAKDTNTTGVCSGLYFFQPADKVGGNCNALLLAQDVNGDIGSDPVSFTITSTFGFVGAISFDFALGVDANAKIEVFDAAGKNLLKISGNLTGDACDQAYFFCNWTTGQKFEFPDVARSIVFTAKDQTLMLDDLLLTTAEAPNPNPLPEPASMALVLGALGTAGWARRRSAR